MLRQRLFQLYSSVVFWWAFHEKVWPRVIWLRYAVAMIAILITGRIHSKRFGEQDEPSAQRYSSRQGANVGREDCEVDERSEGSLWQQAQAVSAEVATPLLTSGNPQL